ncbi:MAG: FAD-dependent oxidoreductase [Acidobacteriaceae bacterium]|nr:FAD-dependent oxidoreductase [Acidobacteriaceae bacterium]
MRRISRRKLLRSGLTLSAASAANLSAWARVAEKIAASASPMVMVEAETFAARGGWVVDQQSAFQMGSSYLMAHGMGVPVEDARTEVAVPVSGSYRVWVRTRDWVAEWKAPGAPGRFKVEVDGKLLETVFGVRGGEWHWQDGGVIDLRAGKVPVALHDLTGFAGRCDAILFAADADFVPPNILAEQAAFRKQVLRLPEHPEDAGRFDLVVAGGGMAGTAAAITAARLGLKVALIQDRPVLGGNTSSEIRVALGGVINLPPYPSIGVVVGELDPNKPGNAAAAANYGDEQKLDLVRAEKNISLFLNTRLFSVEKQDGKIESVTAREILTGRDLRFRAPLFADCTGDATLGYLAGADFRYGRESRAQTGEPLAPEVADNFVNGASVMWYSEDAGKPSPFPETPWAMQFNEQSVQNAARGDWDWELGHRFNQITDFERVRDAAFRAIYGNWSFQKNSYSRKEEFANLRLAWVSSIGGKRESRRLMGDVIIQQQDIADQRKFPDGCVTATWPIDLHHPDTKNAEYFRSEAFRTVADFGEKMPYTIPYRCLYSRNVGNLFMAGRNISVTHVALGTVRVMRTTGMMGEVVGMAAAIARARDTSPRGVYESYLPELIAFMTRGVGKTALAPPPKSSVPAGYTLAWSDEFDGDALDAAKWDYRTDSKCWSTQVPQNVSVGGGNLMVAATSGTRESLGTGVIVPCLSNDPPGTFNGRYNGGGVISKAAFGYGYYECRMRVMVGKGWHSAFWLLRHDGSGSAGSSLADLEFDVMENDSVSLHSYEINMHQWKGARSDFGNKTVKTPPLSDYHVYGYEYTPEKANYFFDGELVHSVDIKSLPQAEVNIWLTLIAAGFNDTDAVDTTRLPGHVYVDYVRFYKKA